MRYLDHMTHTMGNAIYCGGCRQIIMPQCKVVKQIIDDGDNSRVVLLYKKVCPKCKSWAYYYPEEWW